MTADIRSIQTLLGVKADGVLGPISLTALFNALSEWRTLKGARIPEQAGSAPGEAPAGELIPSAAGVALIQSFEQCRLDAYPDPGSRDGYPWTIGWGSTGDEITKGTRWTQEQADQRFAADLARFAAGVRKAIGGAPTSQGQFDAMVSLAYNIGLAAFAGSTLLKKHKAGDYAGAAYAFQSWRFNDGKEMAGLVRRRQREAVMYRTGK